MIPVGEFIENNHRLEPSGWCTEWWQAIIDSHNIENYDGDYDFESLSKYSKENKIPIHPKFNYFWSDLDCREIIDLRNQLIKDATNVLENKFKPLYREILMRLGIFYETDGQMLILKEGITPLLTQLGLMVKNSSIVSVLDSIETENSLALVSHLSGFEIKDRAPTRVGASMGRPEKANERRMKPPPNVLFPLGEAGGSQRLVNTALKVSSTNRGFSQGRAGRIEMEAQLRYCKECKKETVSIRCCESHTMPKEDPKGR